MRRPTTIRRARPADVGAISALVNGFAAVGYAEVDRGVYP